MAVYEQGSYRCVVAEQGFSESKEKKTPCFFLRVQPFAHCGHGGETEVPQQDRTINLYLTDGTIDFVIEDLRALGWNGTSFDELDPESSNCHSFVGNEVPAFCEHEQYNGKIQERWNLRVRGARQAEKLPPDKLRSLNAMFGKKLKSTAAPSAPGVSRPKPTGQQQSTRPAPAPLSNSFDDGPSGDDIPF